MVEKKLLLGDEVIVFGVIYVGILGVYVYLGILFIEIIEFIQNNCLVKERKLYSIWCINEKMVMEVVLGMLYVGKCVLVCMKYVGMNVVVDVFVNFVIIGVNGGLVVLVVDDFFMYLLQNEQDLCFYGKFVMIFMLELFF